MAKCEYTIVFVSGMSRGVAFYRDLVGLPVRTEDFGGRMGVWRDPDGLPVSVMAFPRR